MVNYSEAKPYMQTNCTTLTTTRGGVRQDHVRAVIADSALLSSMKMYAFLLRPGLAALDNLADKFVAGWLLPSKVLDLSYPYLL